MSLNSAQEYELSFIGKKEDLDEEAIYKTFDINYINLNTLPVNYYPIYNKKLQKELEDNLSYADTNKTTALKAEFKTLMSNMELSTNIYNRYLILPISIITVIVWIFIFLYILKYIHINYNIYYIYIIVGIISVLLFFGSIWFLYVNSQLL
jgi:hypothetical protein